MSRFGRKDDKDKTSEESMASGVVDASVDANVTQERVFFSKILLFRVVILMFLLRHS